MLASLQTKAMLLGKNTFLRIDEESKKLSSDNTKPMDSF